MAKKAAKAPGKSPKGGGKKSKKAGTATVPPPLPEYTFAGRTGDEARQAFAEAAAVLRAKLSDAVEHTHVILRVRQVAFDQHDFLLKLPKTAAVGRLQAEIAARQHCGAVTPQDVIVFRTLPDLETYPAGPVATAVGGNESKDASNVVGDVVAAPAVSNRLEPLSRLMDCIPEVGPFNTPTDVSSAAAQPLRQSTADDATPSPPSTPPIPVEKPSPYLGSIITFVHDIPAAQTPGYGQHNPANAPPQRKMTVTGSSNLPTRSFSIASVRDPDGSNSAPSAPTSGAPPAPNASSQLPLAGNYVSVYYDILPYTTVIPHPSLAAYFNATSSDNKAARTQSRSASAGPHHTRPSSSATHRTSRPASSRTATTMTASSGPSPMPGEPPASGRSSALPHHHRRPRGDDDAPLLGRRGRRAPPPIIKGLDRSCALLSLETGRGGFAASTARPGSPPRVLKMDPMLFAQQRNGRAEAAAAAAAAAVAAGRGKKGSVVGAMLGSTMIAAAAVRAAAVGGGEGGMPFLSSTERRRANSVVSAMSDLVERSAMAAAAAAAGDGAPRIDVVEELEEEDESAVEEENRRKTAYIWRRNAHDPPADAKQRGQRAAAGRHRVHELTAPSTFVVDALLKGSLEDGTTPSSTGVTVPDFKLRCSFVTGLIFNGLFFLAAVRLLPDQIRTEGQKGWVLTLCSCTVMSTASIPFLVQYAQMGGNIAEMELLDSDWAVVFSSFFLSYLWMDAVMGILYYKSAFGIVSGWVHHFFYFVLVTFTIYANIPGAFMVACLLEVSTIFLSSGHIWKKLRCDWAFGATFFLTRIAFHPYFAWTVHVSWPGQYYWILAIGVYPFHLWWFYGFIRQQVRLYQDRRKPRVEGDGEVGDGEANEGKWEKGDKCEKEHMAPSGPVPQDSRVLEVEEYEEERTARDAGDHV